MKKDVTAQIQKVLKHEILKILKSEKQKYMSEELERFSHLLTLSEEQKTKYITRTINVLRTRNARGDY